MRLSIGFVTVLLLTPLSLKPQSTETIFPGGTGPGKTATLFAAGLVSTSAEEYGVAVNSDWSEIYFTRVNGEQSSIMMTVRTGDSWSMPKPASFSGNGNDSHPWLSADGDKLFFVSRRPCRGASQGLNVWVADRTADGWSSAASLGSPVTDQTVHAPSISNNGTIYATGLKRLRHVNGKYLPVEQLTPAVKGSHPAVSADESFVIFAARRKDRLGGSDLYVIFRMPDDSWTEPRNLGKAVNSTAAETSVTLSSDGKVLFFSRNDDAWWVDAAIIETLRPEH